ncbi:MAG: EAL domain-containing protein [Nitrospirae bacterium]|nr:EAL domain-containing protein [Nitrospirota bacterium]
MKPVTTFLRILVVVAVAEVLVTGIFWALNIPRGMIAVMTDTVLLTVIGGSLIYLWVVKPVGQELRARVEAIDAAGEMIVITDRNGVVEYVNPAFARTTGYTPAEIIGRKLSLLKSGSHDQAFFRSLWETISIPRVWSGEMINRRKDGTLYPEEQTITPVTDEKGRVIRFVAIKRDITERKKTEQAIQHMAYYDALTGLPNRTMLYNHLLNAIRADAGEGKPLALLLADIDRFKEINDTLGHDRGDEILKQVGRRLREAMFERDIVARPGGDEFSVLLLNMASSKDIDVAIQKILKALDLPFMIENLPIRVEASIGVALYPDHAQAAEILFRRADIAMHNSKRAGISSTVYEPAQDKHSPQHLALMGELHYAIEHNELLLFYQPKISLKTRHIVGVEALVRWKHPHRGMIPPDQFILPAEQTGLIHPLTRWVLAAGMRQCKAWRDVGMELTVSVNLSARNLLDPKLPAQVTEQLQAAGVNPDWMRLEITESAIMSDPAHALDVLTRLHEMGIRLSIDDFGIGYSSLVYLQKLPVDTVKIDKSFVINMTKSQNDAVIVRSTIDLAHNLGLKVIAEGVESEEIWNQLSALGCDAAQGYYMARPMPADDLTRWLHESPWGLSPSTVNPLPDRHLT